MKGQSDGVSCGKRRFRIAAWGLCVWLCASARLEGSASEVSWKFERRAPLFEVWTATFPSPMPTVIPENNTVWMEAWFPRNVESVPAVLVLPVLGAPNRFISDRFMHALVHRGIAAIFVELPFQFRRRDGAFGPSAKVLPPSGLGFLAREPARLAYHFRQAVADVRRAAAILRKDPRIDPERMGLIGTSLGAIVGAMVLSEEERIREGWLLLGGANLADLLRDSEMTGPWVREQGLTKSLLNTHFLNIDPLTYRRRNAGKRVRLYNARWDRVVPAENARALAEAFPDAQQHWVLGGHYSAVAHLVWIPGKASRFFVERFSGRD